MLVFFQTKKGTIEDKNNLSFMNSIGVFCVVFILLYMGLRPLSGFYFMDMATYAQSFNGYLMGDPIEERKDIYFEYFIRFCTTIMTLDVFFMMCAVLYIVPLYIATKRIFKDYWFYAFLMLIISLSFWAYGTNGIRNGIATSLILLALSFYDKKIIMAIILIIALGFHKSTILVIGAIAVTYFYRNTKWIFYFWFISIFLSLALGGFWENFFLSLGLGEEQRITGYFNTDQDELDIAVKVGFRWDFLIYSASGVFAGWYFIIKKKFADQFYHQLFNIYLITNSIWILVIRANFSNRFAYMSWFMLGIVIVYPLLKNQFFYKQNVVVARIILMYFAITFLLNVILTTK
jgi:hypothetical protein